METTTINPFFFLFGVIETAKTLFCNNFEVGHNKEAFCLVFKCQGPDGNIVDTVFVAMSAAGAKTLTEHLAAEMADHEREHGQVEPWKKTEPNSPTSQNYNSEKYVA